MVAVFAVPMRKTRTEYAPRPVPHAASLKMIDEDRQRRRAAAERQDSEESSDD